MAQTPPTAVWEKTPDDALSEYWNAFNSTSSDIKIYVPLKSVETYKKASGWSEYAQYIVGYDFQQSAIINYYHLLPALPTVARVLFDGYSKKTETGKVRCASREDL